jgi:hypothetical protein
MASTAPTKDSSAAGPEPPRDARGGVTWRAALISLFVIAITAPAIFYGEVVFASRGHNVFWSSGVPAPWPLTVLFVLTVLASIPALGRLRLTRPELLTVYSVVLVVTPLFGIHVLFYVLSKVPSFHHMARGEPMWESAFINLIPTWWGPSSLSAVEGYFLGGVAVPWSEWSVPLAAWGSLMGALFLANVCLLVLVQQQWIRNERLTFPLAQIPLESIDEAHKGSRSARLPVSKAFWVGLIIAAVVGFLSQLSQRVPAVPSLPMQITVMNRQPTGPAAALGQVEMWLYPWLISLAYILPKDLSFSVWFLWLVRIGLCALAIGLGAEPGSAEDWWRWTFPAPTNQATGALVALAIWALWTARRHLSRALRVAFSRRSSGEDRDEPLPYRWALLGFAVCFSWLVAFLVLSGCRLSFGLAYVALLVGLYLAYARLQAEGALDPFFWWFNDIAAMSVGMRNLLPQETLTLYTMNWAGAPLPSRIFSACSLNTLGAFKIADANGTNLRRLTYLLIAAFVVALALGMFVTLTAMYHHGFSMTSAAKGDYFVSWALLEDGYAMWHDITNGEGWQLGAVLYLAAGGVVTIFLGLMRLRFLWWPFHPIGYLLSNSIPQAMGTFPFFIAWTLKTLVTRYGGLRLYRQTIPLAIGLIVGDLLNSSLWNIVGLVARGQL